MPRLRKSYLIWKKKGVGRTKFERAIGDGIVHGRSIDTDRFSCTPGHYSSQPNSRIGGAS